MAINLDEFDARLNELNSAIERIVRDFLEEAELPANTAIIDIDVRKFLDSEAFPLQVSFYFNYKVQSQEDRLWEEINDEGDWN